MFVLSYIFWPYPLTTNVAEIALFILWLPLVTLGVALSVYDFKWMELPNGLVYSFGALVIIWCALLTLVTGGLQILTTSIIGSLCFGGFFYIIYQVSSGKWIGGGDVRLCFMLGLLLGWQKTIIGLTLAAYLATAVIIVLAIMGKYHKRMRLPFGPFLLTASFVAVLWGQRTIEWYERISGLSV